MERIFLILKRFLSTTEIKTAKKVLRGLEQWMNLMGSEKFRTKENLALVEHQEIQDQSTKLNSQKKKKLKSQRLKHLKSIPKVKNLNLQKRKWISLVVPETRTRVIRDHLWTSKMPLLSSSRHLMAKNLKGASVTTDRSLKRSKFKWETSQSNVISQRETSMQ